MPKSKKTEKQENTKSTPATSKSSLKIEIAYALREQLRSLPRADRQQIGLIIDQVARSWGHPHLHAGVGIRKLTPTYFEFRVGLRTRLVFKILGRDALHLAFMGDHDAVRQFLKRQS